MSKLYRDKNLLVRLYSLIFELVLVKPRAHCGRAHFVVGLVIPHMNHLPSAEI